MPDNSRVWIYQSSREFTNTEVEQIKKQSEDFISQWTSHGALMDACIEIFYNRFLVLFANEEQAKASGCGIDKSVRFFQELEKQYSVSLFDRMQVAYKIDDKILTCHLSDLEKQLGTNRGEVLVFNNLVQTKKEFLTSWETPLKNSWHQQHLSA